MAMRDAGALSGLSSDEAAHRLAREPRFVLLFAAGLLYLLPGESREGILMFALVVATLGMTLYEEGRAERALAALRDLSTPRALVIRDGCRLQVDSRDLVVGDLRALGEGDRVPADGVLVTVAGAALAALVALLYLEPLAALFRFATPTSYPRRKT